MKKALIVWGGWLGHEPEQVAHIFANVLEENGFEVEISDTLDAFCDEEKLMGLDLIVPIWTGGEIRWEQLAPVLKAVAAGVGIAGCHGGMCDSFRNCVEWQFMTGAQWVSHPGGDGTTYTVNIKKSSGDPLVEGIEDFEVCSEHYYIHIDPAVNVLATTRFPVANWYHAANGQVDVPVVFTKKWGEGRVYYCSLGHHADVFTNHPSSLELMKRGMLWAAEGKAVAGDPEKYKNTAKMF